MGRFIHHVYPLLTRSIGGIEKYEPHILTITLQQDDILSACTDGITDPLGANRANYCTNPAMSPTQSVLEYMREAQRAGFRFKSDDRLVEVQKITS